MIEYLDRDDVLTAGSIAFGGELNVRDYGLLDASAARPQATVFGVDAYPEVWEKAAALLQSLAITHWSTGTSALLGPLRGRSCISRGLSSHGTRRRSGRGADERGGDRRR